MLFLEWYEGLSDVRISERVGYNLLYRGFLGLFIIDDVPDDTTLVKFRSRIGDEVFKRMSIVLLTLRAGQGYM